MRKAMAIFLGSAVLLSATAFTACKTAQSERSQYTIKAEYFAETQTLSASMSVTIPNHTETAFESLKFELWANAFRENATYKPVSKLYAPAVYHAGESYGGITVNSVEGASGYTVCGEDENILSVDLNEALYPDKSVTLNMEFEVQLPQANHRMGVGKNNVTLANFYPVLCAYDNGFCEYVYAENGDPFVSECADYTVSLTVPKQYTAVCSGDFARTEEGEKATYEMQQNNVRDIAFVFGTDLKTVNSTATIGGKEVTVEYAYNKDENPEAALNIAQESLTFFSEKFTPYEGSRYTVVKTEFPYGGMEYCGLTMIASDLAKDDIPAVIAHETAHQWWYASVGSNQFECSWQDEGLAEYSTALFLDAHDYGDTYSDFVRRSESTYRAFYSIKSQLSGEVNTAMTRPLTSFTGAYEYRSIAYDKGVILFDRLKSIMGEKDFFAALKSYAKTYAGKIATPAEMISCFRKADSKAEAIFKSFIDGTCVI